MTGMGENATDAALWRLWRQEAPRRSGEEPDALLLAAYAEGRLSESEAEPVEAWLAEHPEALDDILAARAAGGQSLPDAPDQVVLRAASLVSAGAGGGKSAEIPFPLVAVQRRHAWRMAAAWGGLAASLLVTSLVGFGVGNDAYDSRAGQPLAVESIGHELLDPPSTLFEDDAEPDI